MGGSDDPSNIVELSIKEHALAHKELFEKYGKREDYLAWKGLEGQYSKRDILKELSSLGGKRGSAKCKELKRGSFFGIHPELKRKAGQASTNKESVWWFNGKDYKFLKEKPEGYWKSAAPNNPGKSTTNTKWWNNGVKHKRSANCPGEDWIEGRINKGNLGGSRIKKNTLP